MTLTILFLFLSCSRLFNKSYEERPLDALNTHSYRTEYSCVRLAGCDLISDLIIIFKTQYRNGFNATRKYKLHYSEVWGDDICPPHGTNTSCTKTNAILKGMTLGRNEHALRPENSCFECFLGQIS